MPETRDNTIPLEEKQIFDAINNNDTVLLKALLTEKKNVNIFDENKMTPLQHAAYKGNKEMVQILLDQGADVSLCEHQHNYTALHFAALSGNTEICLLLSEAGAKSTETNTVGRTPSQMAAFVGHHDCVSMINNYVPKQEVEYYTRPTKGQTKPSLPPFLVESFHKFIIQININPIKVIMNLQNFAGLMDHLAEVKNVLDLMASKEIKRAETNEVLSFKFHYLGYVVGEVSKLKEKLKSKKEEGANEEAKKTDIIDLFAKQLLKPGKSEDLESMEAFLKECLRQFPFRESALLRQMVTALSQDEAPTALNIINTAINGQRGFIVARCYTCGEEKAEKRCSKCKVARYCDRNCQMLHWTWHKKSCARLQKEGETNEKKTAKEIDMSELQGFLADK